MHLMYKIERNKRCDQTFLNNYRLNAVDFFVQLHKS